MLNAIFKAIGDIMLIIDGTGIIPIPTEAGQAFLTFLEFWVSLFWLPIGLIMKLFGG